MSSYLLEAAHGIADYGWRIFYASMIFFVVELVWGRNRYSLASRLRGALFWSAYIVITVLFFTGFGKLWSSLGITPLFKLDFSGWAASENPLLKLAGWVVVPVLASVFGEFFYYWFHRAQHKFAFLWAFHSEHHALREMSAWNSNHHFTEEIFRIPFITVPLTLLVQVDPGPVPVLVGLLMGLHGQYEHSHGKLHLGWLRYVIADNRYHRIHHSVERRHFDKNFGSFTSVWDQVFGTAHFPAKGEWPDTGIEEHDEPKKLSEFMFRPFRKLMTPRRG
jgi:sterol desaturase/sphingolipid hydroxylase (fatty acid hydroxylase superfamily)